MLRRPVARLVPIPLRVLARRLFCGLAEGSAYDLPARRFAADPGCDVSVRVHGHRASTPWGPAAGPHTQLAQNLVLSWLAGGRFLELKTVQVRDDLVIPRPCIDMQTVGFNVEWSQELTVPESLEEYVKGAMLLEMLKAEGQGKGLPDVVLDMSVGYDLAGIRSAKVGAFLDGMRDARAVVERLRGELGGELARFRDLPYPTRLSDTLTLSTFHGCPPDEIERIAEHLLRERGLHVVVKLNPTLLGRREVDEILRERLGYADLRTPAAAFEKDAQWGQVVDFCGRLGDLAARLGRGFGVKFTNTLIVENHKRFFPATEREMYLSGPPLHALAVQLVRRFRDTFGDRFPISFSAGIDAQNLPDAAALGLAPITVCTDLLRAGGYGRAARYLPELASRMKAAGAADPESFTIRAYGNAAAALDEAGLAPERARASRAALEAGGDLRAAAGDGFARWVSAARVRNARSYAEAVLTDPRYAAARNSTPPKKIGSKLALFDCLTCDKCIPVCPNDANFSLSVAQAELPLERLVPAPGGGFALERRGALALKRERQIANHADACNACGHCDVMCPEDGGPYLVKPRFFGSVASWAAEPGLDGLAFEPVPGGVRTHARFEGQSYLVERGPGERVRYAGPGFDLRLDLADPAGTAAGQAEGAVDLAWLRIAERLREAVLAAGLSTWPGAALASAAAEAAA
jgi:putative selenate reductase